MALWNRKAIPFPNGGGLFLTAKTINNDQDFVGADGGVAAEVLVVDVEKQFSVTNARAQNVGDVYGVTLNAVETADDVEVAVVIAIPVMVPVAITPIVAGSQWWGKGKHRGVKEAAFPIAEVALLAAAVSRHNVEDFVFSDGRVAAHGLIAHGNSAIWSAAHDKLAQETGNVDLCFAETVLRTNHLPSVVLSAGRSGEERTGEKENNQQEAVLKEIDMDPRLRHNTLRCGDLPRG